MSFNVIFWLMITILLGLLFFSKIFRKKEKEIMLAETNYIDAITNFKNNPVESLKPEIINKGIEYGKLLGLSDKKTQAMIENDFSKVKL
jgi:hypothetical protein